MQEERRDAVEEWAVVGAQTALGYVPVAGPVLAAVFGKAVGSAAQRRTDKIVGELVADVQRLREQRQLPTVAVAESDEFLAATERTVRRLLESDSEEKRRLLRNALLNVSGGAAVDSEFERWLDQLDADDVRVAAAVEELMRSRDRMLEAAASQVTRWFEGRGEHVPDRIDSRLAALVRDGLLYTAVDEQIETVPKRVWRGSADTESRMRRSTFHNVTERGEEFLAYVRDPLA